MAPRCYNLFENFSVLQLGPARPYRGRAWNAKESKLKGVRGRGRLVQDETTLY